MCMCVSHGLTEARVSCSVVVHIIDLRQGFSLNLELGWQPAAPAIFMSLPATALELSGHIARSGFSSVLGI